MEKAFRFNVEREAFILSEVRNKMINRRRWDAKRSAARRNKKREFDRRKFLKELGSWMLVILIAAILGYSIVQFGGQTITIIGDSMNDALESGDTVLVSKISYTFQKPERYDIVAFKLRKSDEYYNVKRIIGMPNETVQIVDGHIFIDGKELQDVPFDEYIMTSGIAEDAITLDDNEYFLMGDNCNNSEDSRFSNVGNVLDTEILGKVIYRIFPSESRGRIGSGDNE